MMFFIRKFHSAGSLNLSALQIEFFTSKFITQIPSKQGLPLNQDWNIVTDTLIRMIEFVADLNFFLASSSHSLFHLFLFMMK